MVRTYKRPPKRPGAGRTRRLVLLGLVLVAGLSCCAVLCSRKCYRFLCRSGLFRVEDIQITGCQHVARDEVCRLAGIDMRSNILGLDAAAIGRALESHPWVREATVRKELPGTLHICVVERQPVAILEDNGLYYVDKDAVIIARTDLSQNVDYPMITGVEKDGFSSAPEKTAELRKLLAMLPSKKRVDDVLPARNISEIHVDPNAGLVLYTVDGHFPIRLGTAEVATKFKRLELVLYDLYRKQTYGSVDYVDCDWYRGKILVRKRVRPS